MPTEAKDIFEATSKSVKEMLSENGLGFYIPPYQRPYAWDKEKVIKLLDDMLHGFTTLLYAEDTFTFLGTIIAIHDIKYTTVQPIVREEVPAKVLTVIDGQQRLSTLLLITTCLHNQIRLCHAKAMKGEDEEPKDEALTWLNEQTLNMLKELRSTFVEEYPFGDLPQYPRMIRAFDDSWSRKKAQAKYESPIAHLIFQYLPNLNGKSAVDYKPSARIGSLEGEAALCKRYNELRGFLRDVSKAKSNEKLEDLPTLSAIAQNKDLQRSLLNHEFSSAVSAALESPPSNEFAELVRLLLFAAYVLNRVALTLVKGKNEDYAFSMFESLNTTGEKLTAFETFKPRVVSAEGLVGYQSSVAKTCMDRVSSYLSTFAVGPKLQTSTSDLLITFALAETGERLAKREAEQRTYLKDEFGRHQDILAKRVSFVQHLEDTASFMETAWNFNNKVPSLEGFAPSATTDAFRLCISFLRELNHSIALGALIRFYSTAVRSDPDKQPQNLLNFESALKALTAFSVLWRSFNRTTANIDREYREIMLGHHGSDSTGGLTGLGPLARTRKRGTGHGAPDPFVDLAGLKAELLARLKDGDHGKIQDRAHWVKEALTLPVYTNNTKLTRFLLLAAYHDTVENPDVPGLIAQGKNSASACFTFDGWRDDKYLSLEHIAPQTQSSGWDTNLYGNKEVVHQLGNLVLVPSDANSSLSDRPWDQKRVLYGALGAPSGDATRKLLAAAAAGGITFAKSTEELVEVAKHMPHLQVLGLREDWDKDFIEKRSRRLLELAWDRLYAWLT